MGKRGDRGKGECPEMGREVRERTGITNYLPIPYNFNGKRG